MADTGQGTRLKRELGLLNCTSLIIGSIIGTGIFVSPTHVLERSGAVGVSLIIWGVAGMISLLGALAFAELGTLVPQSGADYSYLLQGFRHLHPFWGPLPSFLSCWTQVLVLRPSGVALYCLIVAEYCYETLARDCVGEYQELSKRLIALSALGIITAVNVYSVKFYVKLQAVFTVCKLTICALVIVGGAYQVIRGKTRDIFTMEHLAVPQTTLGDIALALFGGLYAFGGWAAVNDVTEEVVRPERNILRSILIGLPTVATLYILMNMAYLTVLSPKEMMSASAVAVQFGERLLGPYYLILPIGVMVSAFGSGLNSQFAVSRLCYVAGREGHLMSVLSFVHARRVTPATAVVSQAMLAILFVVSGDILALIDFTSFIAWIFYAAAMVALITIRSGMKKDEGENMYRTPLFVPVTMILVAVFLCVTPLIVKPTLLYLIALVQVATGVFVYTLFVHKKIFPLTYSKRITHVIQLLLEVVPPDK